MGTKDREGREEGRDFTFNMKVLMVSPSGSSALYISDTGTPLFTYKTKEPVIFGGRLPVLGNILSHG